MRLSLPPSHPPPSAGSPLRSRGLSGWVPASAQAEESSAAAPTDIGLDARRNTCSGPNVRDLRANGLQVLTHVVEHRLFSVGITNR